MISKKTGLLSKIRELYWCNKIARIITNTALLYPTEQGLEVLADNLFQTNLVAEAKADVFDAIRVPAEYRLQVDQRIFFHQGGNQPVYTLIGRYFGKTWSVMAGNTFTDQVGNPFVGGGYFVKKDWFRMLPFIVATIDKELRKGSLNTALYFEQEFDFSLLLDQNIGTNFYFDEKGTKVKSIDYGATISYPILSGLYFGIEGNAATDLEKGKTFYAGTYGTLAVLRPFGQDNNMMFVLQGYLGDKKAGLKLALNFK